MKGLRFYADYGDKRTKRKGGDAPNALAISLGERCPDHSFEAVAAVFTHANSGVASAAVHPRILAECCKRISETEARRIHPALFAFLEAAL